MSKRHPPIPDFIPEKQNSNRALIDHLASADAPKAVRTMLLRLPDEIIEELSKLARDERISRNAVISQFIDNGLKSFGRRGIDDLAPWFPAYLKRDRKK